MISSMGISVPQLPVTSHSRARKTYKKNMFRSNKEDIKSRFGILLTSVKAALEANHVATNDVHTVLVAMFSWSDS